MQNVTNYEVLRASLPIATGHPCHISPALYITRIETHWPLKITRELRRRERRPASYLFIEEAIRLQVVQSGLRQVLSIATGYSRNQIIPCDDASSIVVVPPVATCRWPLVSTNTHAECLAHQVKVLASLYIRTR